MLPIPIAIWISFVLWQWISDKIIFPKHSWLWIRRRTPCDLIVFFVSFSFLNFSLISNLCSVSWKSKLCLENRIFQFSELQCKWSLFEYVESGRYSIHSMPYEFRSVFLCLWFNWFYPYFSSESIHQMRVILIPIYIISEWLTVYFVYSKLKQIPTLQPSALFSPQYWCDDTRGIFLPFLLPMTFPELIPSPFFPFSLFHFIFVGWIVC